MVTLLLILIYLAFISLGLPDALLGAAWPVMGPDLGAPLSGAGLIAAIISGGTITSSFLSGTLVRWFGERAVVLVSVAMTALALFGFGVSNAMVALCLLAVPLGLGAGAIDAVLNNFVALRYRALHMNWLHAFWGLGAMSGPLILTASLTAGYGWRSGYLAVAALQGLLFVLLLASLPIWKSAARLEGTAQPEPPGSAEPGLAEPGLAEPGLATGSEKGSARERASGRRTGDVFSTPGLKAALTAFFCYSAVEMTAGLWGATFLVNARGFSESAAAAAAAAFYGGVMVGRAASGVISLRMGNRNLIRLGLGLCLCGVGVMASPFTAASFVGLGLLGLGCAPIFPAMLHETPKRFGPKASQNLMGFQMGFAYLGGMIMAPLFGVLAERWGTGWLPVYLLALVVVMLAMSEAVNRQTACRTRSL